MERMNGFGELSGEQWEFVKPHLSSQPITGGKREDDCDVMNNGIVLFVL